MSTLRNIRIGGKLALGFGILLVITGIITIYGSVAVLNVDTGYSNVFDYPVARYNTLRSVDFDLMDIRRIVALSALNIGDQAALDNLERELLANRARMVSYMDSFKANLSDDPVMAAQTLSSHRGQLETVEELIYQYIDGVAMQVIALARTGQQATGEQAEAIRMINEAQSGIFAIIYREFYTLLDDMQAYMDVVNTQISDSSYTTLTTLVILALASVILGIAVAMVITKMITKPVSEVVGALENVAHGNLSVNIRADAKDETGILAKSAQTLVATLQKLISDMDHMADDHEKGEIDTFIDSKSFDGEYGTVADKINDMMKSSLDTQNKVVGTFMAIAEGDFKADMEQLPGKKAQLNVAVNDMRSRIEAVSGEINFLIDAAANKGDLGVHIEETKYSGGWRNIMEGLNNLAQAVDKPIVEIRNVMARLGEGRFDRKVDGIYPGDFGVIKDGVNSTIDALNSYISEMSQFLQTISAGDLTRQINREYIGDFGAIKESINNITSTLNKTMSEINAASAQVLSGAKQISTSAMDLANGATEQASSVQELNASIDMISQQTQQNAENADEANTLSNKSSENAQDGNEAMKQMLEAMLQIKESSNNISRIIKVIQDIAFQTNLLSLNAAVEAARAGEHGKGFSVVAEEVRNLAARSQTAATETTGLIEDSIIRVETGSGIAETTAESLDTIVSNASEVLQIINSISSASKDQAEAVSQVSIGLSQISQVVQSNSAVSEETAAAAEELNSQAEVLQQLVAYFRI